MTTSSHQPTQFAGGKTDFSRSRFAMLAGRGLLVAMLGLAASSFVVESSLPSAAPIAAASHENAQGHRADLIDDIIDTINGILGGGSGSGSSGSGGTKP